MKKKEETKRRPGRPSREDSYRNISVTLTKKSVMRLKEEAERLNVNRSNLIEQCITDYLEGKQAKEEEVMRKKIAMIREIIKS